MIQPRYVAACRGIVDQVEGGDEVGQAVGAAGLTAGSAVVDEQDVEAVALHAVAAGPGDERAGD